jgi:recombination protein RecT
MRQTNNNNKSGSRLARKLRHGGFPPFVRCQSEREPFLESDETMNPQQQPGQSLITQQKRTVADLINSEKTRAEIAKVLPKHLTPERMTRVALTATMRNPKLLECTPASLMNALLTCSQAGLEPDGRLAHLIPYGNVVQVIFDYKGLVTLALRNGAESVFADKVCEFDTFDAYVENGDKKLNHRPNWAKERGTAVCYYSVCKRNGEVDWEVMTVEEVESIRDRSKAAKSGPWVTDFDEMAKKTVLRRMSKRWDLLPEIRDVINADDDTPVNLVAMAKPVFDSPKVADKPPTPEAEPPVPPPTEDDGDLGPQPVEERTPEPEKPAPASPLKELRMLLKIGKVREGELLDYFAASGATDGSASSLEEVLMSFPDLVKTTVGNWKPVLEQIQKLKAGAA